MEGKNPQQHIRGTFESRLPSWDSKSVSRRPSSGVMQRSRESRDPFSRRSSAGSMDPGFRRECDFYCIVEAQRRRLQMHAVIFEVEPEPERRQDYLDIAARLRPELERIDGFISVERFQSLTTPDKILSLSFWRDEAAVVRWRRQEEHRAAQRAGRSGIFRTYRLRVAAVVRDYGMDERAE